VKILVLGSGAREHALCMALSRSAGVELIAAPGNPGIARVARCLPVEATDAAGLAKLCDAERVALCVVGPEAPLVCGVADSLRARGVVVFGPSAAAAQVEGSKAFSKQLMREASIPTADFAVFDDLSRAKAHARARGACVVKADGLAAGKGVVVARSGEEAVRAIDELATNLGPPASRLLIEDVLEGEEASAIALCDGERYAMLPSAQDHKRLADGDAGPNTGGMGAYAPAPVLPEALLTRVGEQVIAPALQTLAARGTPFVGALYAGLMIRPPHGDAPPDFGVLEFNARFGDPECQVMLARLEGELLPWLDGAARGNLPRGSLAVKPGASLGIVLASAGYPEKPRKGDAICGIEDAEALGASVFHAGTALEQGTLVSAGGRVLTVCADGPTLEFAHQLAYRACAKIHFPGMQLRHDIGARALLPRG
jgi:phosphoribosylamine---glycine ligase